MANESQPLNKKNKTQANEQFYELLKELVETQTLILQKLNESIEKQDQILTNQKQKAKTAADIWKEM